MTSVSASPCLYARRVSSMKVFIREQTSLGARATSLVTHCDREMTSEGSERLSSSGYFQKRSELPERRHQRRHQSP